MTTCEWCEAPAKWRMWSDNYERFSCGVHLMWTKRLIKLDLGPVLYQFEPVT